MNSSLDRKALSKPAAIGDTPHIAANPSRLSDNILGRLTPGVRRLWQGRKRRRSPDGNDQRGGVSSTTAMRVGSALDFDSIRERPDLAGSFLDCDIFVSSV
jgi:hypothetical protein